MWSNHVILMIYCSRKYLNLLICLSEQSDAGTGRQTGSTLWEVWGKIYFCLENVPNQSAWQC